MISKLFRGLFSKTGKETKQKDFEWEKFQKTAKEQFMELRRLGIKFPIVSL